MSAPTATMQAERQRDERNTVTTFVNTRRKHENSGTGKSPMAVLKGLNGRKEKKKTTGWKPIAKACSDIFSQYKAAPVPRITPQAGASTEKATHQPAQTWCDVQQLRNRETIGVPNLLSCKKNDDKQKANHTALLWF